MKLRSTSKVPSVNEIKRPSKGPAASKTAERRTTSDGSKKRKALSKDQGAKPSGNKRGKRVVGGGRGAGASGASEGSGTPSTVRINRAPVLTLWVAVVAERQGFSHEEALTFGRYISGLLAHSKGKALGMYEEREKTEEEIEARRRRDEELGVQKAAVFGMKVPVVRAGGGRRAVSEGKPIDPGSVESYLSRAFGAGLEPTKAAMGELAGSIPAASLGKVCYKLYERFRPAWQGWGQKGELDLEGIRGLRGFWSEL